MISLLDIRTIFLNLNFFILGSFLQLFIVFPRGKIFPFIIFFNLNFSLFPKQITICHKNFTKFFESLWSIRNGRTLYVYGLRSGYGCV